jgi:hypothetical protein
VEDRIKPENEIKEAEQHEALKQTLLRLLDDPQIQQKIVTLLSRRLWQSGANKPPPNSPRCISLNWIRRSLMTELAKGPMVRSPFPPAASQERTVAGGRLAAHSLRIPHPTASVQFCQCVLYCDRRGL